MGAHTAPPSTTSRWKRRVLGLPVVAWLVIAVAGSAVAALILINYIQPSTVSTTTEGYPADLGGAELGLGDITLAPGDTVSQCVEYEVTATTDDLVQAWLYSSGYSSTGALADVVEIDVTGWYLTGAQADFTPAGVINCATIDTSSANWIEVNGFTGTVADYAATVTDQASGDQVMGLIHQPSDTQGHKGLLRVTYTLPPGAYDGVGGGPVVNPSDSFDLGFALFVRVTP